MSVCIKRRVRRKEGALHAVECGAMTRSGKGLTQTVSLSQDGVAFPLSSLESVSVSSLAAISYLEEKDLYLHRPVVKLLTTFHTYKIL